MNFLKHGFKNRLILSTVVFIGGLIIVILFFSADLKSAGDKSARTILKPLQMVLAVIENSGKNDEKITLSGEMYVDDMRWRLSDGIVHINHDGWGQPITLASISYERSITMMGAGEITLDLDRQCTLLGANIAVLDNKSEPGGIGAFKIIMDKERDLYDSGVLDSTIPPQHIEIDLKSADKLRIIFTQVDQKTAIGVWADAKILCGDTDAFSPTRIIEPVTTPEPTPAQSPSPTPEPSTSEEPVSAPTEEPTPLPTVSESPSLSPTTAPE